jgi:hypothetical protein
VSTRLVMREHAGGRACDRRIQLQQVRLCPDDLGALLEDVECLVLGEPALAIEVVLEEGNVGLGRILAREELFVRRDLHCRCLYLCDACANEPIVAR